MENQIEEPTSPLEHFWSVFRILTDDANRCIAVATSPDVANEEELAFWSRVLARSVFALIEGTTYNLMVLTYTFPQHKLLLSPEEIEELESYCDLYEIHEPSLELNKARMLNRIQHAFTFFARIFYAGDYRLADQSEWVLIDDLYDCRRMLTFPSIQERLIIDDETRNDLVEITAWFINSVVDLLEKCQASIKEYIAKETGPIM